MDNSKVQSETKAKTEKEEANKKNSSKKVESANDKNKIIDEANDLNEKIVELEAEIKKLNDKNQRLHADLENVRRRAYEAELTARFNGKIEVIQPIIEVLDNFERSMQIENKLNEEFIQGIEIIHKNLNEKINSLGVEKIDQEIFDPKYHQSIGQESHDHLEKDAIVSTYQTGYKLGDKVIRTAMVVVNNKNEQVKNETKNNKKEEDKGE